MIKYRKNKKWGSLEFRVHNASDIEDVLPSKLQNKHGDIEIDIVDINFIENDTRRIPGLTFLAMYAYDCELNEPAKKPDTSKVFDVFQILRSTKE